eukprot:GFUD01006924.1.p1 GENE.GFUD01006924.1~~GFUD01006924.1.p1  ORF type:complete len:404 (+),score=100.31 GFUD01006924.1:94-1305(+)
MSDYSNDSVSDDYSNQDNYAGGYDDFVNMIEEAGYDSSDIEDKEFGFDEETRLFQFDPFAEMVFDAVTYQSLVKLTEMTCQLLRAWKKRSSASLGEEQDVITTQDDPLHFGYLGNLYQLMDPKERDELRTYSVKKLLQILGNDEVSKLEEELNKMVKFLRKCLLNILESCLPRSLPYPVLSTILSHLQTAEGLHKVGVVTKLVSSKRIEEQYMHQLYLSLADVYEDLKAVMFNSEVNTNMWRPQQSLVELKAILLARFSRLKEFVDSFINVSGLDFLETLNDSETNLRGDLEMFEKLEEAGGDEQFVGHSDLEMTRKRKIVKGDGNHEFEQENPELDEDSNKESKYEYNDDSDFLRSLPYFSPTPQFYDGSLITVDPPNSSRERRVPGQGNRRGPYSLSSQSL